MTRNLLLVLLLIPLQLCAQNCTTQPAMNTMTIATTNGIVGCTTCGTGGTITVNLTQAWTSGTGWASVYPTAFPNFTTPGNAGSFKILSGNGTMQLILDASPTGPVTPPPNPPMGTTPSRTNGGTTANGVTAGSYVSDLGVIRNSSRNYTLVWTTPGFASDTWVSYGDDEDSVGGGIGYKWVSQDEPTGVINHSITIDKLDIYNQHALGTFAFTVWSNCFNANGTPNVSLSAHLPRNTVLGPNAGITADGFQKIVTTYPDTPAYGYPNEDIFTLQGYDGYPSTFFYIPQQDGTHPGFRVSPGGTLTLSGTYTDSVAPVWPMPDSGVNFTVDDWVGPNMGGFFAVYGKSGTTSGAAWTGQSVLVRNSGGGITINIPSNAADGRNVSACTAVAGAEVLTLDDGTPACAYPLKVTGTRWISGSTTNCGVSITCGPPGTPLTPVSNTPFVSEVWAIIFTPTPVRQGTVGPWISQYTGQPGIPCERQANINIEKPNPAYPNAGCRHYVAQGYSFGANGNLFTYEGNVPKPDGTGTGPWGGQQANCAWNGLRNENTFVASSQPTWFYDGAYVCHRLDLQYPKSDGTNNDEYEKHIFGIQMQQAGWPRDNDSALFGDFKVAAAYTITPNPICNTVDPVENGLCSTMTIPVTGDLTALAAGFAAGTRYRICVNQTTAYSWGCLVFPYDSPQQHASIAVAGNLPAESLTMYITYTTANNDIYSYCPGGTACPIVTLATDVTCPASGNCSIAITSPPAMANAVGYDVFARVGSTGTYFRQNTSGPVPIGTSFTFGTTGNPLQTAGFALPTGTWTASTGNVVAVDAVNNTITTDTANGPLPSLANNANIIIVRQLAGAVADTGTNANTIVCNSCNFTFTGTNGNAGQGNGVPAWATVYCGVTTGDAGAPLYSLAPQHGSQISSLTANVINLATPINCAPGTNFEVRKPGTMPAGAAIFNWSNSPYEVWKRYGNYMGADMILWFVSSVGSPGPGSSSPCCNTGSEVSRRREISLALLACHRAIQVLDDLAKMGSSTARQGTVISPCTSPSAANNRWQGLFTMIDNMTNNNYGRGSNMGSFLSGLVGYVLLDWWLDPLMGQQGNPQFVYWVKRLADNLWADYQLKSTYLISCVPSWPHEWDYGLDANIIGVCSQTNNANLKLLTPSGTLIPVADYWSIYGNMIPLYAFLYWYTGNATITPPTAPPPWSSCCTSNPAPTYGQAYVDMASWIFVHMASTSSFAAPGAGAKTLGEMGLWQDQALTWMLGSSGAPPPIQAPPTYPGFKPPIISEALPAGQEKNEPLFLASRRNQWP